MNQGLLKGSKLKTVFTAILYSLSVCRTFSAVSGEMKAWLFIRYVYPPGSKRFECLFGKIEAFENAISCFSLFASSTVESEQFNPLR